MRCQEIVLRKKTKQFQKRSKEKSRNYVDDLRAGLVVVRDDFEEGSFRTEGLVEAHYLLRVLATDALLDRVGGALG